MCLQFVFSTWLNTKGRIVWLGDAFNGGYEVGNHLEGLAGSRAKKTIKTSHSVDAIAQ